MKTARKIAAGAVIGVGFTALTLWLDTAGHLAGWEAITWNERVRRLAPEADVPVKLILLDQRSLIWATDNGMEWPWPRDVYAYMLSYLRRVNTRAIAFDVQYSNLSLDPPADEAFAAAIAKTPNFIGAMVPSDATGARKYWPPTANVQAFAIDGHEAWQSAHPQAELITHQANLPIDPIVKAGSLLGHVHGEYDAGNQIHSVHPLHVFDGRGMLLLGITAATLGDATLENGRWQLPRVQVADRHVQIGDRVLPINDRGKAILNFYRPRDGSKYAFETYSVADILASEVRLQAADTDPAAEADPPLVDPAEFENCIVIFGVSAPALYDLKATPFNREIAGVEMHATAAANYLDDNFIREAGRLPVVFWTLLLAVIAATAAIFAKRAKHLALLSVILLPLPFVAGVMGYKALVWWPIMLPLLAMSFSLVGGIVLNYATEGKQRRFIRHAFERYLNPGVVDQLVDNPEKLQLGGEQRELSIFFADLSGFTSMSAVMTPHEITSLLNEVLTQMTSVIFEERGTLDKYIGDAIVAFWNAPIDQPDHATRAVRAAIRCQQRLADMQPDFEKLAHGHDIKMRIGVHTGPVVVGNMGSQQQFNYSIIGDAANLASRLEGANKAFGTPIMVSDATWTQTKGAFIGRELANLQVVGRPDPVRVHQPIAENAGSHSIRNEFIDFENAMAMGRDQQWRKALKHFAAIEGDPAAEAYAKYLADLNEDIDAWDGVWRMTKK